jgi:hypothetical protein
MKKRLMVALLLAACRQPTPPTLPVMCPDPVTGCRLDAGVVLRFSTRPTPMQPFELEVEAPDSGAVYAEFGMAGMEMGPNRYRLLQEHDKWRAKVLLPACVQGRRDWVLRLDVGDRIYVVPFTSM